MRYTFESKPMTEGSDHAGDTIINELVGAEDPVASSADAASMDPVPRRRLSANERRDQIIDAAIVLFGARGYNGTTTRALADAAGVSEATVFKHFPTKDALHSEAFTSRVIDTQEAVDLVAELRALAAERKDEALLKRLVSAFLFGLENHRDIHRMLLFAWLEQSVEENTRLSDRLFDFPLFPFLEQWILARQNEGEFVDDALPLLRVAVLALPLHYATEVKLYGLPTNQSDDEVAATFAAFLLRGLRRSR